MSTFGAKDVQRLRQATGAGMMDAKKALEENGGDMEAAVPLTGQVCGRIESVESVADIINGTVTGFRAAVSEMAGRYLG